MSLIPCGSCEDHTSIGCFNHCDSISTGLISVQAGDHILRYHFLGVVHETTISIDPSGTQFVIPSGTFNENGEAFFTIENPDGSTFSSGGFSCFKAVIKITF